MAHVQRKSATTGAEGVKFLAGNRKARHDYHIEETFEAGIVLQGNEVKSIRQGRANLRDGYAAFERGELFLRNCHVSPYEQAGRFHADPLRPRKLLMRREQLRRLIGKVEEKGLTLVPLSLYLKGPYVKVSLGLARGKKAYDRREDIKAREAEREVARASRGRADRYEA
ncbi:MAG: SsrA-binding protein SmpB [candidate division NC10 bacterium]|nr:SsrA-binding protein SmpB [candidate division NC10 bacterium]